MSVQAGTVSRANALQFAQSVHTAIVSGLNRDPSTKLIYDEQVSIDAIHSGNSKIWSRPQHQAFGQDRRRIVAGRAQTLKIEFTFVDVPYKNSMEVYDMMKVFEKQLKSPASPLLSQPIFRTSVIHELEKIDDSNYKPTLNRELASDNRLVSGASALSAVFGLVSVLLALL